ncbi:DUF2239 family protein [Camelimonas sp. ID_303_24]
MSDNDDNPCTAFAGSRLLCSGPLAEVAARVREAWQANPADTVLTFSDKTGKLVDIDPRGDGEMAAETPKRGRGRPKLGVEPREVTLLPRHWEWLGRQPGGASATLRRLVEAARRQAGASDDARARREAAYAFMHAMAGDLPEYEEAIRALFAGDAAGLRARSRAWPADIAGHALRLAGQDNRPE